jgi:hypothetical protein
MISQSGEKKEINSIYVFDTDWWSGDMIDDCHEEKKEIGNQIRR